MQHGQQFYRELAEQYDELFPVDPQAVEYLRAHAPGGRPVLDAACGTGAHVVALEGHGIDAYGIDNSPEMIEIARRRQPTRFSRMDMRDLSRHEKRPFSMIYSIGNSLAHLPLPGDVASFFASAHEVLAPNGVVVTQIVDVSDLEPGTVLPLPTLSGASSRLERAYTVDGYEKEGTPQVRFDAELYLEGEEEPRRLSQRLLGISPDKIRFIMKDEGFREVAVTAGFSEKTYGYDDSRIAVISGRGSL
jgi:SAM-dependent methyltransferase